MATAKKRTTAKRRPSAPKTRKAKAGDASTLKLFGRTYKKSMCGLTKAEATAKAQTRRKAGKGAAIKKGSNGYCLFVRG